MPDPTFLHVDGFATSPLTGNGLSVFVHTEGWSATSMQHLAQEMKQFESIFLSEITLAGARARVFTVEEERPFAGHPVPRAAVVLHRTLTPQATSGSWLMRLASADIPVTTTKLGGHHRAEMNQGVAVFGGGVTPASLHAILTRRAAS